MSSHHAEGRCDCGFIQYIITALPLFTHCCHCRWCQRETGSAFAINALIEKHHIILRCGEVSLIKTPTKSGKGQQIARCPHCHVALWNHYLAGNRKIAFLRVGTLENPDAFPPDIHIFTRSKQPWIILPENIPFVSAYYIPSKLWPEASLIRREALKKALI